LLYFFLKNKEDKIKQIVILFIIGSIFNLVNFSRVSAIGDQPKLKIFTHHLKNPDHKVVDSGICTTTTNDQNSDYGLTGWQMPKKGLVYRVNYSTKPASVTNGKLRTTIANAFGAWHSADAKQKFKYRGASRVKIARRDNINNISWAQLDTQILAATYVWYYPDTGRLLEIDTVFNQNLNWTQTSSASGDCGGVVNAYDIQNVATHEFGHWLGLDDLYNETNIDLTMYGYGETKELKKDTLGRGDILGARAVLP